MSIAKSENLEIKKIPVLNEQLLSTSSKVLPRAGEGSAVLLKDGTIFFVYGEFLTHHDNANACLVSRKSIDKGVTWSEKEIFQEKSSGLNVMSASLLRLNDDSILFLYIEKDSENTSLIFVRKSFDDGNTWSEPIAINEVTGYYVVNNDRLYQTSTGRILLPCAYSHDTKSCQNPECGVLYSDDNGESWTRSAEWIKIKFENIIPPQCLNSEAKNNWAEYLDYNEKVLCQEPGVIELTDGTIMMWARTDGGYMYRALSDDQGDTWGEFEPVVDIIAPLSPQSIKRIPDSHRLICVYNDHRGITFGKRPDCIWRTPQTIAYSDDEGKSWNNLGELETKEHSYCYTSILFADGYIFFTYYQSIEEFVEGYGEERENLASLKVTTVDTEFFKS